MSEPNAHAYAQHPAPFRTQWLGRGARHGHAAALAEAARTIHTIRSLEDTLGLIARAAQLSIPGVDHVGISTVDRRSAITTRVATDEIVWQLDDLQHSLMEGPCVDALRESTVVTAPNIRHDARWPRYVAEAVQSTGLQSQMAVRLFLDDSGTLGGLNMYSTSAAVIDTDAPAIAELFAAHAAVAVGNARKVSNLNTALGSRKSIGQALGIIMERYHINEDGTFAFLTRASSHGNIKLNVIAQEIVAQADQR